MKKDKMTISLEEGIKSMEMRTGLWDNLDRVVRHDPYQRFSNRSEAIRYMITKFIEDTDKKIAEIEKIKEEK